MSEIERIRQTRAADVRQRRATRAVGHATADHAAWALQRRVGNRALGRMIQAKLTVGPADDPYEREAERVAAQIAPAPQAGRPDDDVQPSRRASAAADAPVVGPEGGEVDAHIERELASSQGGGMSLPPGTRAQMEAHFGADFSGVRVHTGAQADRLNRQLGAQAFTWGSDIYMADGKYNPASRDGQRLLAHELTHVVQQAGGARRQVRRLMSTTLLKALAGEPKADKKLGRVVLYNMSVAYKAVLNAIDRYHGTLGKIPARYLTEQNVQQANDLLNEIERTCRAYIRKHPKGSRTARIQAILDSIPAERAAIQQVLGNRQAYPYTLRDAIERAHNTPVVNTVAGMMTTASNRQVREANEQRAKAGEPALNADSDQALAGAALQSYESDMNAILKKNEVPIAQNWRGNTATTSAASALGGRVMQDYFKSVIAPELSQALSLPDALAEADPARADLSQLQGNIARMRSVYESFMLLFTAQGARKVPPLMAKFCAELYALARRKQMSEEQAYLLVSSQLFLRTINPMLTQMAAAISEGKPGKRALVLLSKLVQDDANNIPHGSKEPFMAAFNQSYKEQVREFVMAVIEYGNSV